MLSFTFPIKFADTVVHEVKNLLFGVSSNQYILRLNVSMKHRPK